MNYEEAVLLEMRRLMEPYQARQYHPRQWLEMWDGFVIMCEEGYSDIIEEYMNDIFPRTPLQKFMKSELLSGYPEHDGILQNLSAIDDRFRALLIPVPDLQARHSEWWLQGLPRYGCEDFKSDVLRDYGVQLEDPPTAG